jgi:hypothetical protein
MKMWVSVKTAMSSVFMHNPVSSIICLLYVTVHTLLKSKGAKQQEKIMRPT